MENIDSLETQYGQISENTTPSLTRPSLQWLGPFSMDSTITMKKIISLGLALLKSHYLDSITVSVL